MYMLIRNIYVILFIVWIVHGDYSARLLELLTNITCIMIYITH